MHAHGSNEASNGSGAAQHSESGGARIGRGAPPAAINAGSGNGDEGAAAAAAPAARAADDAAIGSAASATGALRRSPRMGGLMKP